MKKQPPVLNLVNFTKTGVLVVDMLCMAIIHERSFGKEPLRIRLNHTYFDLFRNWVEKNFGEETANKDFYIDHVEICKQEIFTGKILNIEHLKLAQA